MIDPHCGAVNQCWCDLGMRSTMSIRRVAVPLVGVAASLALVIPPATAQVPVRAGAPPPAGAPARAGGPAQPAKVPVAEGYGGAVATVDLDASKAALAILKQGGNAMDAAVAGAAALGV